MYVPLKYKRFVELVAQGETQQNAFLATIGKNKEYKSPVTQASKLASKYRKAIDLRREQLSNAVEKLYDTKEAQNALQHIITQAQADAIICDIITGKKLIKKAVFNPLTKCFEDRMVEPDHNDIITAYAQYCKRFGSYAPKSLHHKIDKTNTLKVEFISPPAAPTTIDITPDNNPSLPI
jgi:hypothetical protein